MVQCPRCGHINDPSSRFCVGCGNRLGDTGTPAGAPGGVAAPPAPSYEAPPAYAPAPNPEPAVPPGYAPPVYSPGAAPGYGASAPAAAQHAFVPAQPAANYETSHSRLPYAETSPPLHSLVNPGGARAPAAGQPVTGPSMPPGQHSPAFGSGASLQNVATDADVPRTLVGFLISYDANPIGQFWPLHRGSNLLGRAGAATSAHVELPHATVSSRHATLQATVGALSAPPVQAPAPPGGHAPQGQSPYPQGHSSASGQAAAIVGGPQAVRLFVADHGSTNGTYVNDVALAPDQQRELNDGDRVRLGLFNLIVKII